MCFPYRLQRFNQRRPSLRVTSLPVKQRQLQICVLLAPPHKHSLARRAWATSQNAGGRNSMSRLLFYCLTNNPAKKMTKAPALQCLFFTSSVTRSETIPSASGRDKVKFLAASSLTSCLCSSVLCITSRRFVDGFVTQHTNSASWQSQRPMLNKL